MLCSHGAVCAWRFAEHCSLTSKAHYNAHEDKHYTSQCACALLNVTLLVVCCRMLVCMRDVVHDIDYGVQ